MSELIEGNSLFEIIHRSKFKDQYLKMMTIDKAKIALEIANALKYLHS